MRKERMKKKMKMRELTPASMRCIFGQCPALFETDHGTLIVIGRVLDEHPMLKGRIGLGEVAIEVPRKLFDANPSTR